MNKKSINSSLGEKILLLAFFLFASSGFSQNNSSFLLNQKPQNNVPVARNDTFRLCQNNSLSFTDIQLLINDTEPEGSPLAVDYIISPDTGLLTDDGVGNYIFKPDSGFNGIVSILYVIRRADSDSSLLDSQHFYEFVDAPRITWEDAKIEAETLRHNWMKGYLATITTESENDFVSDRLKGQQGWIGASDKEEEGVWKWVTGPEAGTHFSDQYLNGLCSAETAVGINGYFANWYDGEPNDCRGLESDPGEDYAHFYPGGVWNDYPNYVEDFPPGTVRIKGYIVEYGGLEEFHELPAVGEIVIVVSAPPTIDAEVKDITCFGYNDGSITLDISGGYTPYSYMWSNGEMTQNLDELGPGEFSLVLTDSLGCVQTGEMLIKEPDSLKMRLISSLTDEGYNLRCAGGNDGSIEAIVEGGTSPYTFSWSNGDDKQDADYLSAGYYSLEVSDSNRCTISRDVELTEPPKIEYDMQIASPSCLECSNGSIIVKNIRGGKGPYNIRWEPQGFGSSHLTGIGVGNYRLYITDSSSCVQSELIQLDMSFRISNAFTPNGDGQNDLWLIKPLRGYPSAQVNVYNRNGELVFESAKGYPDPWDGTYNGRPLPTGTYYYVVSVVPGQKIFTGNLTIIR